jgi:hypothetical protein
VTSKVVFHKKIEPEFQFILQASITIQIKAFKKKGKRKGKEHVRENEDTNDTKVDYVKLSLHGNTLASSGFVPHE